MGVDHHGPDIGVAEQRLDRADPSMLCIDRTGEVLRDIGAERQPKMSEEEFKEAAHKTDKTMLFVLLIFVGLICLSIVLSMFFSK